MRLHHPLAQPHGPAQVVGREVAVNASLSSSCPATLAGASRGPGGGRQCVSIIHLPNHTGRRKSWAWRWPSMRLHHPLAPPHGPAQVVGMEVVVNASPSSTCPATRAGASPVCTAAQYYCCYRAPSYTSN